MIIGICTIIYIEFSMVQIKLREALSRILTKIDIETEQPTINPRTSAGDPSLIRA
jgi:hypothetical protein